jgi:hypothetical protein
MAMSAPARAAEPRPARRAALGLLVVAVVLAHAWVTHQVVTSRLGWGAGDKMPTAIEVAFVRELQATAPAPLAPPPPVRPAARHLPAVAAQAASAPGERASQPAPAETAPPELTQAQASEPAPKASASDASNPVVAVVPDPQPAPPAVPAPVVIAPAVAAASAVAFAWPPSTRLTYKLTGNYRGAIEGSAQVEWVRLGQRYQVRMQTAIGPVLSRKIASEGELGPQGLVPRRFDAEQRVVFSTKHWGLRFGPEQVLLSDGREVPTVPGAQDEASQFVQLTWLFSTQPERLKVGQSVDMPLALTRKLERWTFDVVAQEVLHFAFGDVDTFHVKPRREAQGGDMTAEMWLAPAYQTLPVRVLIRQNQESWVDMTLDKPPMQAAETPSAAASR